MVEQFVSFAAPLLYLLFFTASLVFLTKRSFGKCLPLTMMLSAFLLFFSQLICGTFNAGFVVGILFAVSSIPIGIAKRKQWDDFKKNYFTSGLIVFLTVYVLVFIYDLKRGFTVWDEFSHWGVMVKEMFRLDGFYSVDASNLMVHKDYPPIMQLFELFWIKLCGGFKEVYAERALHTFELSLFIPFVAEKVLRKKGFWKNVLIGSAMMLSVASTVILFDVHGVFQSIYTDYAMALVVTYLLMTIFASKEITWFEIATLSIGGGFLLLLKQMGLPLYLMVICFFTTVVFLRERHNIKKYLKKMGLLKTFLVLCALILPFVLWFIWGKVAEGVSQQFDVSSIDISDFLGMLFGRGGEDWQRYTAKKYLGAIGQNDISTSFIPLSYIQGVVLFMLLVYVVYRFLGKNINKKEIVALAILVVMGSIGYAAVMLLLYTMSFGSYEGPMLASFDRYMGTYEIIMFTVVLLIVIWQTTLHDKAGVIIVVAACLALLIAPSAYYRIYPEVYGTSENYTEYKDVAERIKGVVKDDDARVFVLAQNLVGYHYYLQYFATPIKINNLNYAWPVGDDVDAEQVYDAYIKPYLEDFDYLYVADIDDNYEEAYCIVTGFCPLIKNGIYKIKKSSGKIQLELLSK